LGNTSDHSEKAFVRGEQRTVLLMPAVDQLKEQIGMAIGIGKVADLDRLRHNAYCLTLDGASYRSPKQAPTAPKSTVAKQVKSPAS